MLTFKKIEVVLKKLLLYIINLYQKVSRHFPPRCRFYPTCSEYTKQAIIKYGIFKGSYLGIKRILRCHPLNPGGYDPIP
ncbi:membrane protein insertion efficiency factor YidD [bacterium]|nr:membrane protein insertion efficiency factor YidD [bacterium]